MSASWFRRALPRAARALGPALLVMGCGLAAAQAPAAASAVAERLQALQHQSRAHPEQAAAELARLVDTLAAGDGLRIVALEQLGLLRAGLKDSNGTERVALQLEALAQGQPARRARAEAAAALVRAQLSYFTAPTSRAEPLIARALQRLPEDTPPRQRLRYLLLAADIHERAGRLDDAVRLYLQAMQLADGAAPAWQRSDIRSTLAYLLWQAGQKERAAAFNDEAIALAREAADELSMSGAMTTQSMLLGDRKDDAGELAALRAAMEHARRADSKGDQVLTLANLADYYLKHAQYTTALDISAQALPLARQQKDRGSESLALTNMGLALISLHRKAEGLQAVRDALAIEERTGALTSVADTYSELGIYLERAGELKDALDAYRQHRRLADEVFHQEQQQVILELQERYDNTRRQREIELLHRESRLKEEQLLQRELQQRLWALGAALALLALGVIVLLVQRGRRANRLLASTNELLKVQSERDPLTGLANRRHFRQALNAFAEQGRIAGTIYLLDIDHFKHINDRHGHAAGDAVLVEIARRLRATLREEDLIVRWGGEEFLVIVRALAPDQVEALAQRLLAAVAGAPVDADSRVIAVSASIGFATFPLEPAGVALPWERAIELVDTAMYLAKAHGRNRAYGIRLLHADDEAAVEPVMKTLEQSWRDGRVALTALHGPAQAEAAP